MDAKVYTTTLISANDAATKYPQVNWSSRAAPMMAPEETTVVIIRKPIPHQVAEFAGACGVTNRDQAETLTQKPIITRRWAHVRRLVFQWPNPLCLLTGLPA